MCAAPHLCACPGMFLVFSFTKTRLSGLVRGAAAIFHVIFGTVTTVKAQPSRRSISSAHDPSTLVPIDGETFSTPHHRQYPAFVVLVLSHDVQNTA
ncbi:hypothetical protein BV25DRAFT_1038625 [Artomyces pyxidatus]|uniref:Uncharacterized protein n=1 Tax=Artomyces pyxidatus TaxID=48021 RepID=A0ACB8STQ9_9AGAM|nr:hypothetical protein BV25DRAFT_1038625 [Artomyces pyxidatus]